MKKPKLCHECWRKRVLSGLKNARAKGKIIGRKRIRNSVLIESLLDAGLSYREISRIAKCSHGSVHAQKNELKARRAKEEQARLDELTRSVIENKSSSENSIETMKAMQMPEEVIQQVQSKIEADARGKVHHVMGGEAYETYD